MTTSDLVVRALTPGRIADLLELFDGEAFADNPAWSFCYCQCFYEDHSKVAWSERTAAQNRALAQERARDGRMRGHLAYLGGRPVGWCNAVPRSLAHALDDEPIPNPERVGTILCFVVVPRHRGKGIARALLRAACDGFREAGLESVEAFPRPDAQGPAENHFGPLSMFLDAGFEVVRTDPDGSVEVRLKL